MWFPLSLVALFMLTVRRSAEKRVAGSINSMAMTWLQQAMALPFIIAALFFAKFYVPSELPGHFWLLMAIYVLTSSLDLYCYFKALSMADLSYIAPTMSLFAVGNLIGAYFVLGQVPSLMGVAGAGLIMLGAYLNTLAKRKSGKRIRADQIALWLALISVLLRSYYSNIEVEMLRVSNPTSYNFYTSALTVPLVIILSAIVVRQRKGTYTKYWSQVRSGVQSHLWPLLFIGLTYTINFMATYHAKLISPNAAYVGAVKSAAILPTVLIGALLYKERVVKMQWTGLALILLGLVFIATN